MKLTTMESMVLRALIVIAGGVVVLQTLGLNGLVSVLFSLSFALVFLLWFLLALRQMNRMDVLVLGTLVLAFIHVMLNLVLSRGGLSFAYIKKFIIFCASLLFLQTACKIEAEEGIRRLVRIMIDVVSVVLLGMYIFRTPQMHLLNGMVTRYLTFRFTNPNLTALYLASLYILELSAVLCPGKRPLKIFRLVLAVVLFGFIIETDSRNTLLAVVVFTAIYLLLVFSKERMLCIHKWLASCVAVFPAFFLAAYMLFVKTPFIQKTFAFMVEEGKRLDSRVSIWSSGVSLFLDAPLLGSYYEASGGTGSFQFHNTHLDIAVSYGVVVLVLICIILTGFISQRGKIYKRKSDAVYMLGFAAAIVLGMGEAALFSGGLLIYVFIGLLLLLVRKGEDEVVTE